MIMMNGGSALFPEIANAVPGVAPQKYYRTLKGLYIRDPKLLPMAISQAIMIPRVPIVPFLESLGPLLLSFGIPRDPKLPMAKSQAIKLA